MKEEVKFDLSLLEKYKDGLRNVEITHATSDENSIGVSRRGRVGFVEGGDSPEDQTERKELLVVIERDLPVMLVVVRSIETIMSMVGYPIRDVTSVEMRVFPKRVRKLCTAVDRLRSADNLYDLVVLYHNVLSRVVNLYNSLEHRDRRMIDMIVFAVRAGRHAPQINMVVADLNSVLGQIIRDITESEEVSSDEKPVTH